MATPPERLSSDFEQGRSYGELKSRVGALEQGMSSLREEFTKKLDAQTRTLTGEMERRFVAQEPTMVDMRAYLDEHRKTEGAKRRAADERDRKLDEISKVAITILIAIALYGLANLNGVLASFLPRNVVAGVQVVLVLVSVILVLNLAARLGRARPPTSSP